MACDCGSASIAPQSLRGVKIYVDIDDVVTETARTLCKFAHQLFGRNVSYENVFAFDLRISFSLDDSQIAYLMDYAHSPDALDAYPETFGATSTIASWIRDGGDVTFVTGRPASTHNGTRNWLKARGLDSLPVLHVDKFGRDLGGMFNPCDYVVSLDDFLKMHFDFAVEDSPIGLGHLAKIDNCRVAVFDRPWNAQTKMPSSLFRRCSNWSEVDLLLRSR